MAKRPSSRNETLKEIGLVIVGGLAEVVVENFADAYLPQYTVIPGSQPYNMGDALGALEATVLTLVGVKKHNKKAKLLGAGGLAVAVPNLVGKTVINMMTPTVGLRLGGTRLGSQSLTPSIGRYGRNGGATTALGYRGTAYPRR